ncbi:hypothetical protein QQS21_004678 [Conoideocrella luteorostrata]|uniref:Xylanolytic transcriptional activator regulatory domain-containing protein n=1 Tax=Conoideocrella luteorostrata TaxID=1105319 RepID=A0AAJ0CTY8_9HYPO|nr:hypothetical protein QQS21_004678 [Conoideocrella luteorostrata]
MSRETLRAEQLGYKSRMCFVGSEPSNFSYLIRQTSSHPSQLQGFHFSNRQYQHKYTAYDIDNVPREAFERPDKATVDKLVCAYFVHINRSWPVVDEQDFMSQLEGKDERNPLSLPLFNAVLLVGAHAWSCQRRSENDGEDVKRLQAVLFRRAKTLMDCRFEQDRFVHVQVAVLLSWYSDGLEEVVANAWYWIGTAARTAVGLGMHRDSKNASLIDVHKRSWIRLWWVLFQFDTLISLSYGRPQALPMHQNRNLDDSDVPDLQYKDFEGIQEPESDFVIQHSRLCVIISQAYRHRWALRASAAQRIKAAEHTDESLAKFATQLPPQLQLSLANPSTWQAILHITYYNFLILLHRPPPVNIKSQDPPSQVDVNSSIHGDAGMALVSLLESLHANSCLRSLPLFGVQAILTAIVFVKSQLRVGNPLVAAKSMRMVRTLSAVLQELSYHWNFAKGLLRLCGKNEPSISDTSNAAVETLAAEQSTSFHGYDEESARRPRDYISPNRHCENTVSQPSQNDLSFSDTITSHQQSYLGMTSNADATSSHAQATVGSRLSGEFDFLDDFLSSGALSLEDFFLGGGDA